MEGHDHNIAIDDYLFIITSIQFPVKEILDAKQELC
jgi:hypothetical protein